MGEAKTDLETFFILDLMRQKREKVMRRRKDDLINEMAWKMREDRKKANQPSVISYGGFVGVENLTKGTNWRHTPSTRRRTPAVEREEPTHHVTDRADLLIMGMIRDEREKKQHEKHHVYDEMAAVPSEDPWSAKYDD